MNEDERSQLLAELIERPEARRQILDTKDLDSSEREELATLVSTGDAVWLSAQGAPALENDPVAAILGLVPDRECRLDSKALVRARKRTKLSVSDVAEQLRNRGWEFTAHDVFRWQTRSAEDVPPAAVQAVAEILGTPIDTLVAASPSVARKEQLRGVRGNPFFDDLVDRWAHVQQVSRTVAAAMLEGRMLATVHRGEQPDTDQLLRSLDALVTSVEKARQG